MPAAVREFDASKRAGKRTSAVIKITDDGPVYHPRKLTNSRIKEVRREARAADTAVVRANRRLEKARELDDRDEALKIAEQYLAEQSATTDDEGALDAIRSVVSAIRARGVEAWVEFCEQLQDQAQDFAFGQLLEQIIILSRDGEGNAPQREVLQEELDTRDANELLSFLMSDDDGNKLGKEPKEPEDPTTA